MIFPSREPFSLMMRIRRVPSGMENHPAVVTVATSPTWKLPSGVLGLSARNDSVTWSVITCLDRNAPHAFCVSCVSSDWSESVMTASRNGARCLKTLVRSSAMPIAFPSPSPGSP